jgi:cell wall-associated NlpC family hydrolase
MSIKGFLRVAIIAVSVVVFLGTSPANAMSSAQKEAYQRQVQYFDTEIGTDTSCASSNGPLTGKDNEEKAWNYFKAKGLDDTHVAAIIGNFMQESHLNPEIMQKGGNSKNPSDAGSGGWGIAQWSPGGKVVGIAQSLNINGPIYELATQLDIVWGEMNGTSPAGAQNMIVPFKQKTTLADAVSYFTTYYEAAGVIGIRLQYAQVALAKYGGGSSTGSSSTGSVGSCGSALSPDCQTAVGSAKIICAAKAYDTVSYVFGAGHGGGAAWHKSCPTIGPSCGLDCSGLVNIAVYDAFGVDLNQNTNAEAADSQHWQHVPLNKLQPGDLIQPDVGHVEIVERVTATELFTFGAHHSGGPQADQVSSIPMNPMPLPSGWVGLHWIGK